MEVNSETCDKDVRPEETEQPQMQIPVPTSDFVTSGGGGVKTLPMETDLNNEPQAISASTEDQDNDKVVNADAQEVENSDTVDTTDVDREIEMTPEENTPPVNYCWRYELPEGISPSCLTVSANDEFSKTDLNKKAASFLKGCKWAPDGSCLLSCSDDDKLRIFNFPTYFSTINDWKDEQKAPATESWNSSLKVKEGGLVYDYCWYPLMSSMDPVSSCFLTTSSEAPVHLWDAFTGKLRASYQPYNHLDQLISAYSLAFDSTGESIYCGFEKSLRIFNITRPGRECTIRTLKQPLSELNQCGIIANIVVNPSLRSFYALGSFDKTVGLYCDDGSVICLLQGHVGGITHMKFSNDGLKLFTGGRRDSRLICWDMRQLGEAYKTYERVVTTHQRIYFDVTPDDRYLVSGGTDGLVKIWDLQSEDTTALTSFRCNSDCVNGVSVNPFIPILATASGQRHFLEVAEDSDDEELFVHSKSNLCRACDIKLWKLA